MENCIEISGNQLIVFIRYQVLVLSIFIHSDCYKENIIRDAENCHASLIQFL